MRLYCTGLCRAEFGHGLVIDFKIGVDALHVIVVLERGDQLHQRLRPFLVDPPAQDPLPSPHLRTTKPWAIDLDLRVSLESLSMRRNGIAPVVVSATNFAGLYWTIAQQLAHHTVSGCNARVGDLMGSGTISGETRDACGSLLEITRNGAEPLRLPDGTERTFLEDDDEVILTGWAQGKDYRVGFGDVRGRVVGARGS